MMNECVFIILYDIILVFLSQQDKNAQGDTSVSVDNKKKLADKVEKCREEREKAKDAYQRTLDDLNGYNGKYMEDMTMVIIIVLYVLTH